MVSTDVAMASFVVFLALTDILDFLPPDSSLYLGPVLPLFLIYIVSLLVALVSLTLNIPLLRKTFREREKLKELGLSSLSRSLWKESRGRGALFGFCLGLLLGLLPRGIYDVSKLYYDLYWGIMLSLVVVSCLLIARGPWVSWGRGALFGLCIGLLGYGAVRNFLVVTNFAAPYGAWKSDDIWMKQIAFSIYLFLLGFFHVV